MVLAQARWIDDIRQTIVVRRNLRAAGVSSRPNGPRVVACHLGHQAASRPGREPDTTGAMLATGGTNPLDVLARAASPADGLVLEAQGEQHRVMAHGHDVVLVIRHAIDEYGMPLARRGGSWLARCVAGSQRRVCHPI